MYAFNRLKEPAYKSASIFVHWKKASNRLPGVRRLVCVGLSTASEPWRSAVLPRCRFSHTPLELNVPIHDHCLTAGKAFVRYHSQASTARSSLVDEMASPGNRMHWDDVTTEFIAAETDRLISQSKAVYDAVGSLSADAVTYDNVIKACTLLTCWPSTPYI
jgi:hypothetical protein